MRPVLSALISTAALIAAPALAQQDATPRVTGEIMNSDGKNIGSVSVYESPSGTARVNVQATGLAAGTHGVHFHETGSCEDDFQAAGGHIAGGKEHGLVEAGPHDGDMPNAFVQDDGILAMEAFNPRISVENELMDDDGAALIIHSGPDDYQSQPSGDAGDRVGCAVLEGS